MCVWLSFWADMGAVAKQVVAHVVGHSPSFYTWNDGTLLLPFMSLNGVTACNVKLHDYIRLYKLFEFRNGAAGITFPFLCYCLRSRCSPCPLYICNHRTIYPSSLWNMRVHGLQHHLDQKDLCGLGLAPNVCRAIICIKRSWTPFAFIFTFSSSPSTCPLSADKAFY